MYKGTTPTFTLTFPDGVDFTQASEIVVTFRSPRAILAEKTGDAVQITGDSNNTLAVFLTQEETLAFPGQVMLQVNWTYEEGGIVKRACSEIAEVEVDQNLHDSVI